MPRATTGYLSLLRIPGAAAFFLTAALGRVGIAMTGLGLVWLLHARTGSYGTAGLATAGFALGQALIGPHLARLVDRYGQTRALPYFLLAHGAAIAAVLAATNTAAAIAAAVCAGAAVPQLGALSGARWAHLLRGGGRADELPSAFSLESLANATAFLLGPVLVTTLGAVGDATLATGIAAALILTGGAALTTQRRTAPPPNPRPPTHHDDAAPTENRTRTKTRSTLLSPTFLVLALLNLAIGLYFGTMGVSVSAFAVGHGTPGAAAPIMAAASLSGLLAGWLYGLRRHPTPPRRQLVLTTAYLTATAVLLPLASSAPWLGAAVVLTEAAVPPTLVLFNVLTEQSVHASTLTQAFSWNNSASAAGSALAASLAGRSADTWSASASFLQAPIAGALLLALATLLLRIHRTDPADQPGPNANPKATPTAADAASATDG